MSTPATPAARHRRRARSTLLLVGAQAWAVLLLVPPAGHSIRHGVGLASPAAAATAAAGWLLMVVAMMAPLLVGPVRHLQDRSFTHRRSRAVAEFLTGYGAAWAVAGAALAALPAAVDAAPAASAVAVPAALLLAAVWESSPAKQRCLNATHTHPALRAHGIAADLDAVRFGITHGAWCAGSCWAVMLLPLLVPAGLTATAVMAGGTAWLCAQRLDAPTRPRWALRYPGKAIRLLVVRVRWRTGARAA